MNKILISSVAALALVLAGCGSDSSEVSSSAAAAKPQSSAQLNLSHIECVDGTVIAHFVLLFYGESNPGTITGTYNDGVAFGPTAPDKYTGNVWHYNVALSPGYVEVKTAFAGGASLHNPSEYADYYCVPPPPPPVCGVTLPVVPYCPGASTLTSPESECAAFDLVYIPDSKDELPPAPEVVEFTATSNARLAIVKAGLCYNLIENVSAGETVASPTTQGISHVTYCACPEETAATE